MVRQLREIPKVYDNITGEVIAIADAEDLNIAKGEILFGPTFRSPSLIEPILRKKTTKSTVLRIWQKSIRDHVRLYTDGLIKLDGCFGHSVTFAFLKSSKDKVRSITKPNGQLKADFIKKLAGFMAKNRSKSNLNNTQLILYGIAQLISDIKH